MDNIEAIGKMTQENTVAIAKLTVIAQQTSKDTDKLVKKLDEVPAVRVTAVEKRLNVIERRLPKAISTSVIMWGVVILLSGIVTILTIVNSAISSNANRCDNIDIKTTKHISKLEESCKNAEKRIDFLGLKIENLKK